MGPKYEREKKEKERCAMKRELIIGIILAVVCGLSVKDVLDAIRCRKREEELSLRLQVGLVLDVLMVILLVVLLVN